MTTLLYQIPALYRPAGMERVLCMKVNWLAEQRDAAGEPEYRIVIATTDQRGRTNAFPLNPAIRTVDLGIDYEENNGKSFLNKLIHFPGKQHRHKKALRQLITDLQPDIVISMFGNEAAFVPSVVAEVNRQRAATDEQHPIKTVLEVHFSRFKRIQYARKGLFALADRLRSRGDLKTAARYDRFVVLTEEDKTYWGNGLPNMEMIPNPRTYKPENQSQLTNKTVLACGRYSHQKGFERLIEAWAEIMGNGENKASSPFHGWVLRVAGDGENRPAMEQQIENLGLRDSVVLGPSSDMSLEYLNAGIFALSSRYEGLPMVLLEAQAFGLPIVAFECKCGPRDVITDGVDGLLVPEGDVSALAGALRTLMADGNLRQSMGAKALQNSEKYDVESIMTRWKNLFERL